MYIQYVIRNYFIFSDESIRAVNVYQFVYNVKNCINNSCRKLFKLRHECLNKRTLV